MKKSKPREFNISKAKRKLDRIFSGYILNRDKRICQRCGRNGIKIDTSHILPREILSTRWMPENAIGLCVKCHKYGSNSWHKSPIEGYRWLESKFGKLYIDNLLLEAGKSFKFNEEIFNKILSDYEI